ncbi:MULTISPECIES: hypothetical protein [unclassified Nonomuraea]
MATSAAAGAVLPGAVAGAPVGAVGVIGVFLVVLAGAMCLPHRRL